jgi:hypothetical protein
MFKRLSFVPYPLGEANILGRSSILSLLLLIAVALVGTKTYSLWKSSGWELPGPAKSRSAPVPEGPRAEPVKPALVGTETIVSRNLFDPERGEGRTRQVETSSRSAQRIRGMVLLGTAIVGNNRFAIVRDQAPAPVPGRPVDLSQNVMRLKVGDSVEGFRLSEISDKRIVFTQGASNIEVALDYFRKDPVTPQRPTPSPQPGTPVLPRRPAQPQEGVAQPQVTPVPQPGQPGQVPPVPRVIPNLPRRERLPLPRPNPASQEKPSD